MNFPPKFYLTAIAFISTSILVQSSGQLIVTHDPRTDSGPTKKLSRISAVYDADSIRNLNSNSKVAHNEKISVLQDEPFFDVPPGKTEVTANIGQGFQASGDGTVDRNLIRKRDTAAENTDDEGNVEYQENGFGNSKGDLFDDRKTSRKNRGVREMELKIYEINTSNDTVSVRLAPIHLELDAVDFYEVKFVKRHTQYSNETFQATQELNCKLWDNALCFENLKTPKLAYSEWNGVQIQVTGTKNEVKINGKEWKCNLELGLDERTPSPPTGLTKTFPRHDVVKLKWKHPLLPYTKIQKFEIRLGVVGTSLLESQKVQNQTIYHPGDPEQKEYETEIAIYPSSTYHIEVSAINRNGTGKPMKSDDFTTPVRMNFKSAETSTVTHSGAWIEEVPAVINATVDTWVTVTLKGNLKCMRNAPSESPSTDQTSVREICFVGRYKVNQITSRRFIISENGTSCSEFTCDLQPGYSYTLRAKAKDHHTNRFALFAKSFKILIPGSSASNAEDSANMGEKPYLGWLAIFPIIAIIAVILLFVWHR